MASPFAALRAGVGYLTRNPGELVHLAKNALGMRVAIPLDALRWFISGQGGAKQPSKKAPRDVVIGEKPPAITFAATVDLMGTSVRAHAAIRVEDLRISPAELIARLRLSDVSLALMDMTAMTPVAALIKSGALDLSRPGNLANFVPKRPAALLEAKDDLIVLDLLRVEKIAKNDKVRKLLNVMSPMLEVKEVRIENDHLVIAWRPRLGGIRTGLLALRN
jgi:hypothetical protein